VIYLALGMKEKSILVSNQFNLVIRRLCCELIENHGDFSNTVIIGLQPRGIFLANRISKILKEEYKRDVKKGELDVTFYRDDFRRKDSPLIPSSTKLNFAIEGKQVILIDDVLFTGRTIRSGMDAMMDLGRPSRVELLVLIDRKYSRDVPIQPNYTGLSVDTMKNQRVNVTWSEIDKKDQVSLFTQEGDE
jgi:pyrimidine operon attenuation protein/uracil phosphoribosyltransferase